MVNSKLQYVAIGVACLMFFLGGFLGFYFSPKKVEKIEVEKIVEVEKKVEVLKFIEVEKRVEVKGETKVITRERIVYVDGSSKTNETETTKTDTETQVAGVKTINTVKTETVFVDKERRVEVLARDNWLAGVTVGANLNPAWQPIPAGGLLSIGLSVDRRIIGPIWLGVYAQHTGVLGGKISFSF
jgi:hypothetical protein